MIGSQTNIYLSVIIHLVLLVGIFGRHGALLVRLQEDVEQTNDLDDCVHIDYHAQHVEEQIADDRLARRRLGEAMLTLKERQIPNLTSKFFTFCVCFCVLSYRTNTPMRISQARG